MRGIRRISIVALVFVLLAWGQAFAGSPAMGQLKTTIDSIIDQLKMKDQASEIRKDKITSLVMERFDFGSMSKRAMGRNWRKLNNEQKDLFTRKFSTLLKASYLGRIDAYTNETVEFVKEQEKKGKVLIETEIVTASTRIPMDYKLLEKSGQWLVYDVVVEGVSLIRNYRNSYNEIFRKDGFDGLIAQMDKRIAEL